MQYRPDIDGLRAIAVLPVVFYHAGFGLFSGGFVGVDIFFVISGFLITSLIYPEVQGGSFSYYNFYQRRVRRLFPALFTMVCCCLLPAYTLLLPEELEDFGQSVASLTLFSSNILFFSEAGYFAAGAELKPLLHTWSLAIEEQYYLFFPMLLLLVNKLPAHPLRWVTGGVFALSLGYSAWAVYASPDAAFYLLPSRTWELLLGSLLAMYPIHIASRHLADLLCVIGLGVIGFAIFMFDGATAFPGLAALVPCGGTACLILGGQHHESLVARLLSKQYIVFFGLISYSLYLWHWPILVFTKHFLAAPLSLDVAWLAIALSVGVSIVSWRYVEKPFRGANGWLPGKAMFRGAGAFMALFIVVGLVFDISEGLPQRLPSEVTSVLAVADDRPANRRRCEGIAPQDIDLDHLCKLNDNEQSPSILFWGDSHANMLVAAVAPELTRANKNGVYTVANGCVPALNTQRVIRDTDTDCVAFNNAVIRFLESHSEITTVVLAARWALHARGTGPDPHASKTKYLARNGVDATDEASNLAFFDQGMQDTVDALVLMNKQVIVFGSVPEAVADVPVSYAKLVWRGVDDFPTVVLADFVQRQEPVFTTFERLAQSSQVQWLPLHTPLCNDIECELVEAGMPLYFDDNHLSRFGTTKLAPLFESLFK